MTGLAARLSRWGRLVEDGLLVLMLGTMVLLAGGQIVLRNLIGESLVWSDQLLRILVLWVGVMGAVAASRDNNHVTIDLLSRYLPERSRRALESLVCAFTASVCVFVAWHAGRFVIEEYHYSAPLLGPVPGWVFQSVIPFGFALIGWRYAIYAVIAARSALRPGPAR